MQTSVPVSGRSSTDPVQPILSKDNIRDYLSVPSRFGIGCAESPGDTKSARYESVKLCRQIAMGLVLEEERMGNLSPGMLQIRKKRRKKKKKKKRH